MITVPLVLIAGHSVDGKILVARTGSTEDLRAAVWLPVDKITVTQISWKQLSVEMPDELAKEHGWL